MLTWTLTLVTWSRGGCLWAGAEGSVNEMKLCHWDWMKLTVLKTCQKFTWTPGKLVQHDLSPSRSPGLGFTGGQTCWHSWTGWAVLLLLPTFLVPAWLLMCHFQLVAARWSYLLPFPSHCSTRWWEREREREAEWAGLISHYLWVNSIMWTQHLAENQDHDQDQDQDLDKDQWIWLETLWMVLMGLKSFIEKRLSHRSSGSEAPPPHCRSLERCDWLLSC